MRKISIELNINEAMAVKNFKHTPGCLEHNLFWTGLLVKHNVLPLIINLDTIKIDGDIAEVEYHPKNKSDLIS